MHKIYSEPCVLSSAICAGSCLNSEAYVFILHRVCTCTCIFGNTSDISLVWWHILSLIHLCCTLLQICCPSERIAGGNSLLLGQVISGDANIGIQISPSIADSEKHFDMIFSMDFVKLMKQSNKLQFEAIPKANSFVEKVDKDWVTVTSSTPNSYELSCSIYSSLNACPLDKVCVVEVRE